MPFPQPPIRLGQAARSWPVALLLLIGCEVLLLAAATGLTGVVDVALVLALLGAFASVAFVLAARGLGER